MVTARSPSQCVLQFAAKHYASREVYAQALRNVVSVLDRYHTWLENSVKHPDGLPGLHWHDFDETSWDVALAKILCGLDEFRLLLPKKYSGSNMD